MTPAQTKVTHHTLSPVQIGTATCFGAVRLSATRVRAFFDQTTQATGFARTPEDGVFDSGLARVVPIRGKAGLFVDVTVTDHAKTVDLQYRDDAKAVPVSAPISLLEHQDCVLTTINQSLLIPVNKDDPAQDPLADLSYLHGWIKHHAIHQRATAVVILNRLGPVLAGSGFAGRLSARLDADPITGLAHVLIVDVPVATGRIGAGDARHPIFAPEAPGKNRMQPPKADPWRAPFGDEVLLAYLHHAVFAKAGGVTYLDTSDWLTAPQQGQPSIFDAARNAKGHAISLIGQRAFTWKAAGNRPAPGDHICTPFDMPAQFARWVICPALMTDDTHIWRPHRIIGARMQSLPDQGLFRLSSLRHPQAAAAQLAPRSSLKEDDRLIALSRDVFGHDPVRMPHAPAVSVRPKAIERGKKIVLVTAMKNEGPFLLEWIAYHRAIGVSDIVVFTNDCTDGTDDFLKLLAARGIVEHYDNPYRQMQLRPQHAGFRAAEALPTVQNADWLMTLDVDEFINIHVGDGHLNDLFAHVDDANLISCTWRLFGNGGRAAFRDDFVTRQFTDCASQNAARPHQAWGFKTLYQNNGYFKKLGVHRPKGLHGHLVDQLRWVNGSGKPLPDKEFRNGWRSNSQTIGYDLVTLNHYAVRSTESFLVKRDRGRVNHVDRDQGSAYWFRMNHNTTQDRSIQRMLPMLEAEVAKLMTDPEIKKAHETCVMHHRNKIAELLKQPAQRAFYDSLNDPRAHALSQMLPMFGANVFLAGPDAVPQALVDRAAAGQLPADHYFTVPRPTQTEH